MPEPLDEVEPILEPLAKTLSDTEASAVPVMAIVVLEVVIVPSGAVILGAAGAVVSMVNCSV